MAILFLASCKSLQIGNTKPVLPEQLASTVKNHQATVLFWWQTQCPCVTRYQSRMEALEKEYSNQSVAFLAVASNADESFEKVQKVAKERLFKLPFYDDQGAALASEIGVRTTPTAVLLDQNGEVKFIGWIDNERPPGTKGRISYLEDALKEVLSGEKIELPRAPTYGCRITKSL